jgi:hypothetical protein
MLITEFKSLSCKNLSKLLKEQFNYSVPIQRMTIADTYCLLKATQKILTEIKKNDILHQREKSASYNELLLTKQLLEKWFNDHKILCEKDISSDDIIEMGGNKYFKIKNIWYEINIINGQEITRPIQNKKIISQLNTIDNQRKTQHLQRSNNDFKRTNGKYHTKTNIKTHNNLLLKNNLDSKNKSVNNTMNNNVKQNNKKAQADSVDGLNKHNKRNNRHKKHYKLKNFLRKKIGSNIIPVAAQTYNFLGASLGAFKRGLEGQGIPQNWGKMLPSVQPSSERGVNRIIDDAFITQVPFSDLTDEQQQDIDAFLRDVYTPGKVLSDDDIINKIEDNQQLSNFDNDSKAAIATAARVLNNYSQPIKESIHMKRRKITTESKLKNTARQLLQEGEMESAESILAAKDLVDRLTDSISELGKMVNDELPALVDSIRGSLGADAATQYQNSANLVLNDLLSATKQKKDDLEKATLVLSGDEATDANTDLELPDDTDEFSPENSIKKDNLNKPEKKINPMGRETRIPTKETYNKKLTNAKIIAINEALHKLNKKKNPIKAQRLAEELRRLVTYSLKEEANTAKFILEYYKYDSKINGFKSQYRAANGQRVQIKEYDIPRAGAKVKIICSNDRNKNSKPHYTEFKTPKAAKHYLHEMFGIETLVEE